MIGDTYPQLRLLILRQPHINNHPVPRPIRVGHSQCIRTAARCTEADECDADAIAHVVKIDGIGGDEGVGCYYATLLVRSELVVAHCLLLSQIQNRG